VLYSIETPEDINLLFEDREWNIKWQKAASKKGIVLKGIGTAKGKEFFDHKKFRDNIIEMIKKRSGSARVLPFELNFPLSIASFKDFTGFFSRSKNIFYVIHNEDMSKTIQVILDFVYEQSKYENLIE